MAALERENNSYEIVFKAFDTLARRAAAAAGLGYFPLARSLVAEPLVIEGPGVLPVLPPAEGFADTRVNAPAQLTAAWKDYAPVV